MSARATYILTPTDVVFFGDGRPFSAGDHFASGLFPPPVTTLYGAFRSALIADTERGTFRQRSKGFGLDGTAADVVGSSGRLGTLTLAGAALCRDASESAPPRLHPPPLDLLSKKDATMGGPPFAMLRPAGDLRGVRGDLPSSLQMLLPASHPGGTFYTATSGFLTDRGFTAVLAGETPQEIDVVPAAAIFLQDPRTSVSLRGSTPFTGTAIEGLLFTVDFVQVREGVGLVVDVEGVDGFPLPDRGVLKLGGEGRPAYYKRLPHPHDIATAGLDRVRDSGRVRMVLTTPAPFQNGWYPDGFDVSGRGHLAGVPVTLAAAAVGRPVTRGGWDIERGRPRRARPAVPPGSVYYLTLDQPADADALYERLDGRTLLDGDDAALGYGLVRLGHWTPLPNHV